MNEPQPVEEYLDELYRRLPGGDPRRARRLLDEAADHLHETTEELVASGLPRAEAEAVAVQRFGATDPLVAAARHGSLRALVVESSRAIVLLGGLALVAVGLSGGVAAIMNAVAGYRFVGALPQAYSAADCRHFLALHPSAAGCSAAAAVETAQDAVSLRVLAGLVGVVALLAVGLWRRHSARPAVLPPVLVETLAAAAFGAAAVAMLAQSVDLGVHTGSRGIGFYLSGALVALCAAVLFTVRAARTLLVRGTS